jgi:hypothetical protein
MDNNEETDRTTRETSKEKAMDYMDIGLGGGV